MRFGPEGKAHLTYCSNIHPGEEWGEVRAALEKYVPGLKAALSPEERFGVGLRLSNQAAVQLLRKDILDDFARWLEQENLYVFTINGFPYGGFHREAVKDRVYAPDWTTRERVRYTRRLIEILARLLPDGMEGSISTVPLSYKGWFDDGAQGALRQSAEHLSQLAGELHLLRAERGVDLHLDLEPEPGCLIENTEETVDFFTNWLRPMGREVLPSYIEVSEERARRIINRHVQVCYDTCHFAVEYEEPAAAINRFMEESIGIGKVQISAAVQVALGDARQRGQVLETLQTFDQSTYLHQVLERDEEGELRFYSDLPKALPHLPDTAASEWRIHLHVPLFLDSYGILQSTQDEIEKALVPALRETDCRHYEIETYTWDVLPPELTRSMEVSIRREYEWVLQRMNEVGLNG